VTADARSGESSEAAGVVIARLRRRAGLTGQQLGALVRMSQAKISRIETAQSSLTAADAAATR
jgi:transcriptional regulator with XRE-family HTH domain